VTLAVSYHVSALAAWWQPLHLCMLVLAGLAAALAALRVAEWGDSGGAAGRARREAEWHRHCTQRLGRRFQQRANAMVRLERDVAALTRSGDVDGFLVRKVRMRVGVLCVAETAVF
jgi:hypothetical protein